MTWGATAIGGATVLGGYLGGQQQAAAQEAANKANIAMTQEQTAEGARQFDILQAQRALDVERASELELSRRAREDALNRQIQERFGALRSENLAALDPFRTAGVSATQEQQALLGLSGKDAQAEAMARFTESPGQQFLRERQEKALLRNAAAIGGLGGGNVRSALQEEAFGRAQTDLQNRLNQLSALGATGLTAAQGGIQMGSGPSYLLTGTDTGVATTTPSGPKIIPYRPSNISGGDSSGGLLSLLGL
jgi:hypothetical protein